MTLTPLQEQVLGYVDEQGPVSVADVAASLLVSPSSARSRLETLERRGLLAAQMTGHHRGRGRAYVTTARGGALAAEIFDSADTAGSEGDAGEGEHGAFPVRLVAYSDGTFTRVSDAAAPRGERNLTWSNLTELEQAAVTRAHAAGGSGSHKHVTVVPGRRLTVLDEWWERPLPTQQHRASPGSQQ